MKTAEIQKRLSQGYNYFRKVMWNDTYVALAIENDKGLHFFKISEVDCDYRCDLFDHEGDYYLRVADKQHAAEIDLACFYWRINLKWGHNGDWTKDQLKYMRKHYSTAHGLDLCLALNKSHIAIKTQASLMKLKKRKGMTRQLFAEFKKNMV